MVRYGMLLAASLKTYLLAAHPGCSGGSFCFNDDQCLPVCITEQDSQDRQATASAKCLNVSCVVRL